MKIAFYQLSKSETDWVKSKYPRLKSEFFKNHFALDNLPADGTEIISIHTGCTVSTPELEKMPNLRLIVTRTAGVDHIDLAACKRAGVMVANCPGLNATAVAEFVFSLMLNFIRQVPSSLAAGKRLDFETEDYIGTELYGKTMGIIGTGAIGSHVAQIAKGFGMNLVGFDYKKNAKLTKSTGLKYLSVKQVLQKSDFVTLHIPATPLTEHMFNRSLLSYAKPSTVIINTARGSIVDPRALIQSLKSKKLGGYLADVLDHEMQVHQHGRLPAAKLAALVKAQRELVKLPNVMITPHVAYASRESSQRILSHSLEIINKFTQKKKISTVI